jgi:glycosyltransferase involved in cell wall biosynthesis
MHLSLVLPCYNEEENAEAAVRDVFTWFLRAGIDGEVIAVNDGSRDRTQQVLEGLQKEFPQLKIVRHERNLGYGAAVRSGCDAAEGEIIGFMDSDGQFRAEDLRILLVHIDEYPFVTGRRRKRADPVIRVIFGKLLGLMIFLTFGVWIRDVNCGMKIFRRSIWPSIRPVSGLEKFFNTEMFLNLKDQNIPWQQVDVPHYRRERGSPTGGTLGIIIRMFRELAALKRSRFRSKVVMQEAMVKQ